MDEETDADIGEENAHAASQLAHMYLLGTYGVPRDEAKANELYTKAGETCSWPEACMCLSY